MACKYSSASYGITQFETALPTKELDQHEAGEWEKIWRNKAIVLFKLERILKQNQCKAFVSFIIQLKKLRNIGNLRVMGNWTICVQLEIKSAS